MILTDAINRCTELMQVVRIVDFYQTLFNQINTSIAFRKLLLLQDNSVSVKVVQKKLLVLEDLALSQIQEFSPRELSLLFHAIAKKKYQVVHPDLLAAMETQAVLVMWKSDAVEISNIVWSFATMKRFMTAQLLYAAKSRLIVATEKASTQSISNTLWSFASMKIYPGQEILALFESLFMKLEEDCRPEGLSNILWACAKLRYSPSADMVASFDRLFLRLVHDCNAQEISIILWGYTSLGLHINNKMFPVIDSRLCAVMHGGNPQNVCNVLQASYMIKMNLSNTCKEILFARVQELVLFFNFHHFAVIMEFFSTFPCRQGKEITKHIETQMCTEASNAISHDISRVMLSYSNMNLKPGAGVVAVLESRLAVVAKHMKEADICNVFLFYACRFCKPGEGLLKCLEYHISNKVSMMSAKSISTCFVCWAVMKHVPDSQVVHSVRDRMQDPRIYFDISMHDLSFFLWAICVMSMDSVSLLKDFSFLYLRVIDVIEKCNQPEISRFQHVFQIVLTYEMNQFATCRWPTGVRTKAEDSLRFLKNGVFWEEPALTKFQKQVRAALLCIFRHVEVNFFCHSSGYYVDFLATGFEDDASRRIVFEIDQGGVSFSCRISSTSKRLKRTHLKALGYTVVFFSWFDWMKADKKEKVLFLRRKIVSLGLL